MGEVPEKLAGESEKEWMARARQAMFPYDRDLGRSLQAALRADPGYDPACEAVSGQGERDPLSTAISGVFDLERVARRMLVDCGFLSEEELEG